MSSSKSKAAGAGRRSASLAEAAPAQRAEAGTAGPDRLMGTSGDDVLNGFGGDDRLEGLAGDDVLNGGGGDDLIEGGAGADLLDGGAGVDTLSYATSNARVAVRLKTGVVSGGHAQGDVISGFENVVGSAFNDTLIGSNGRNRLEGGDGDDYLDGLAGDDVLVGGAGADRLVGGDGIDTADYSSSAGKVAVRLKSGVGQGGDAEGDTLVGIENLIGSVAADTLIGEDGANRIEGGAGKDYIDGLGGDDRLFGDGGDDRIFGGDGDDVIEGGAGADLIDGGAGIDTADYSRSTGKVTVRLKTGVGQGGDAEGDTLVGIENLIGSVAADTLIGDDVANRIEGGAGKDYIDGQGGDDRLFGDGGDDRIFGRDGDDVIEGGAGADLIDGGAGIDTADYSRSTGKVAVRLKSGLGEGGDAEGDTLVGIENLIGSVAADTLIGDDVANRIEGGAGKDYIDGQGGDDRLFGDGGDDRIFGRDGDDMIEGGAGADQLDGGAGIDTLSYAGSNGRVTVRLNSGAVSGAHANGDVISGFENVVGSAFNDTLIGDGGANVLVGGDGDDYLDGLAGNDRLDGGAGDDRVVGGAGADILSGGDGHDTLIYTASDAGVTVRLSTGAVSGGHAQGDVIDGFEAVIGSRHKDTLIGSAEANRLEGGDGDDYLDGLAGDDVIVGGAGNDRLKGGDGADLFVFHGLYGQDSVLDFVPGQDRIQLDAGQFANFAELKSYARNTPDGVRIERDGQSILIAGLTKTQLTKQMFEFVAVAGAPAPVDDQVDGVESQPVTFSPLANDPGAAGLTITRIDGKAVAVGGAVVLDGVGEVRLNADQTLTFTPVAGINGPQSFTYTVRNAEGLSQTATATVDLAGVSAGLTFTVNQAGPPEWIGGAVTATSAAGAQSYASVAALEGGGHVVVWTSGFSSGGSGTLHARRFDASGAPVGSDFAVGTVRYTGHTATVGLEDGGFLVVWQELDGLVAQRFSAAGATVGTKITVGPGGMSGTDGPAITQLESGDFLVSYSRAHGGYSVWTQRLDSSGALSGAPQRLNEALVTSIEADIAALADGGYLAAWTSSNGIFVRAFDGDGAPRTGDVILVQQQQTASGYQRQPSIVVLEDGTAVVVWQKWSGSGYSVMAQRIDAEGQPLSEPMLVQDTGGYIPRPMVHALEDGGYAVAFNGSGGTTLQRYDASGAAVGGPISTPGALGGYNAVALNAAGDLVVVSATLGPDSDITFRRVDVPSALETDEDLAIALSMTMTQVDPNEPGQVRIVGLPEGGSLSAGARQQDGSWLIDRADLPGLTLTPPPDFTGVLHLQATAFTDGDLANGVTRSFGVTFQAVNDAPRPVADVIDSLEDHIVTFSPLANDVEVEGEAMTITHINGQAVSPGQSVTITGVGTLKLNADGTLTFTPAQHWKGEQGFTYTVRDASGASSQGSGVLRLEGVTDGATFSYGQLSDWTPTAIDAADVRVNAYTSGTQSQSSIAALKDGGYLITWVSAGQDGSGLGVFAQRYDRTGQKIGDEFQVNHLSAGDQQHTAVLALDDGGWVIAWSGPIEGTGKTGVYARRYDADGEVTQTHLVSDAAFATRWYDGVYYNQGAPTLAQTANGGFMVGWTTFYSASDTDIWRRSYDAEGVADNGTFISADAGLEDHLALVRGPSGHVFRIWQEVDGPYSGPTSGWDRDYGIYLATPTGAVQLNTTIAGNQTHPTLTILANGNMVAAWQSADASGTGIVFRLLDEDGQPILGERWANRTTAGNQSSPGVVALADGTFIILWTSAGTDGSGAGIYGQRISADGSQYLGSEFRLNATTAGDQFVDSAITDTSFTVLADGTLVATWWGDGEVHHRRFDPPEAAFTAYQGQPIAVPLTVNLVDPSETFELAISNLPPGATLSAGTQRADGAWVVTAEEAASLTLTPPPGYAGDMLLRIEITTIDGDSRATAVSYRPVQVLPVDNEADGAVVTLGTGADAFTGADVAITQVIGGSYTDPGVAGLTGGGHVVVWSGQFGDVDGWGVRAKVYDAAGNIVSQDQWGWTGDFTVNTHTAGAQQLPTVLALADGGFAVFWHSFDQDGSEVGIYGQRFNPTGVKVGGEFRVNTTTAYSQEAPTATLLSDGGFVVLFESEPVNDAGFQIRGQRYDADGVAVGGEFLVRDKAGSSQRWPDVTALEDGGFVAVWTSYVSDGSGTSLEMRVYDDRNDATVYRINQVTAGSQIDVKVTTLADGSFLATWTTQADLPGAVHGVYARRFEVVDGVLVGHDEFAVIRPSAGSVAHPDVIGLPDGGWIVLWNWETPDDSGVDLFAQRYDALGREIGEVFRINAEAYGDQYSIDRYADPMISLDANGDLLVVWHDARNGNIYSRRFDIDPEPPFVGAPGEAIKVMLQVTPNDASETVEIVLSNLPEGTVLSAGAQQPDGSWRLEPDDLDGLTLTTPANYAGGDFDLVVTVTTRDGEDSFTTVAYKRVQVWSSESASAAALAFADAPVSPLIHDAPLDPKATAAAEEDGGPVLACGDGPGLGLAGPGGGREGDTPVFTPETRPEGDAPPVPGWLPAGPEGELAPRHVAEPSPYDWIL